MVFDLNGEGVRQLLQSSEMQAVLTKQASQIKGKAGSGYKQDIYVGENRANAMVYAATKKARRDNRKNNTLLKAMGS